MAGHSAAERGLEARLEALDTLRMMFAVFQETQKDIIADSRLRAQLDADMQIHQLTYDAPNARFIAIPDGQAGTDEVDALQLLELLDLAERYDAPIEVEGILVNSFIPATFIVDPCGTVRVQLANEADINAAWQVVETEYDIIIMMELEMGWEDVK